MKKHLFFVAVAFVAMAGFTSCSQESNPGEPVTIAKVVTVADFEKLDVTLNDKGFWNGGKVGTPVEGEWGSESYYCTATSGLVTTHITYSWMDYGGGMIYDWYMGIALSNSTKTTLTSLDDQYNNIVGGGAGGSKNYAVVYGDLSTLDINVAGGAEVTSIDIANSAYTMKNVLEGDGYSPKFAKAGDHIFVNIEATKNDGTTLTKTVKLAEFTSELSYIQGWETVSLADFGRDVTKLTFKFDAHNSGVPQYFCFDNIVVTEYR